MKNKGIVVGLDIGTTKIAVIVGRKNEHGKIEILGHGKVPSIGVKHGLVANIDNTVQSIRDAVAEAAAISKVDIKFVNVGIAGKHIKSMQQHGQIIREDSEKEISQEDIDKLCNDMYNISTSPGEEILDVIPQEYTIDGEPGITMPKGSIGSQLEANFHIIIGQTNAAKNIYRCVRKAGLEVVELILEPIASAEAVLNEDEKEAGVALVDIGGGTSDIAIFHGGIIRHTAVIPLGGEIITEDIKEGCAIIKKHAEQLKLKFGSAMSSENRDEEIISIPSTRGKMPKEISMKNLASIIQARMEEIIEHIYYEIKNSGYEKRLIEGIVLTGGGSQLKHIAQLTEFLTALETRIGYPNEHLAADVPADLNSPTYSTGIGLVIEGLKRLDSMPVPEPEEVVTEVPEPSPLPPVQPSKKFLNNFLGRLRGIFEDEMK